MLGLSLHPEGPATGQLNQGFPWFSLVPEQMLSWYPNSTHFLCVLFVGGATEMRPRRITREYGKLKGTRKKWGKSEKYESSYKNVKTSRWILTGLTLRNCGTGLCLYLDLFPSSCDRGRHLLCWTPKKELNSITSSYVATACQSASSSWCRAPLNFPWVKITLFLLRVGRPLWREDGSVICSAITHRIESRRTHNHQLPQPGKPGPLTHIPQEQGGQP
jgi:hypothetical protein